MFEIFATISDDHGTRTIPTGYGYAMKSSADVKCKELALSQPDHHFYVEVTTTPDHWNSY